MIDGNDFVSVLLLHFANILLYSCFCIYVKIIVKMQSMEESIMADTKELEKMVKENRERITVLLKNNIDIMKIVNDLLKILKNSGGESNGKQNKPS